MKTSIKTKWNFGLYYKNDKDKQIDLDFKKLEKAITGFERKYKNKEDYLKDSKKLFLICQDYEKLSVLPEMEKVIVYFLLRRDVDSNNKFIIAKKNEYSEKINKISNKLIFFNLKLGKVDVKKQKEFLNDKLLSKYKYFLKRIFQNAKYNLSEPEEKIINLLNNPSESMWVSGFSKVLNNQEVKFKGKNISINEAFGLLSDLGTRDRRGLYGSINKKLMEISDFSEAEINAIVAKKKTLDELRGFSKPYSETILSYENEEKVIENLVDIVSKNFKISQRFYRVKAKLLKEKKLYYADRGAKVGELKRKFSFEETVKIISSAFDKFDHKYSEIFNRYLENGQIDVYPAKGKRGGAYCMGTTTVPNMIMLNHTNDFNSVMTLGHEMGHAIHTELSKKQSPIYSAYTISVAETASTLFENFVFEEIFERLSEKEKIIALHNKLGGSVATIFRQIACFNFEKELHKKIREDGYLSKEDIAKLMNKHMRSYLGPIFDLSDEDGYFFTAWSHIRRFFYVYSYAFGGLISDALFAEYKKDIKFKRKIEQFLCAGGSKSPEDIFAEIGVDIRNPSFFEKGLKIIEKDVERLEKLVG